MLHAHQIELEKLGLSATEAQIYLTLLRKGGAMRASAVASTMRIPRSTVYLTLNSLVEMGLVETEAGYGGRFSAVSPDAALPSLVAREMEELSQRKQELLERKSLAGVLANQLRPLAAPAASGLDAEQLQVFRDPRVIGERFARLQLEAKKQADIIVKAPILIPRNKDNPAQQKAQRRGVRFRGLYELAVVEHPDVKPYLKTWVEGGEEARVYDGELPLKLAIFDRAVVMLPLLKQGDQTPTLILRNEQVAESMNILFEFLWNKAKPLAAFVGTKKKPINSLEESLEKGSSFKRPSAANGQREKTNRP